ncbi:MAG TPA: hypothetical protein VD794_13030 [Flavisolibacter sp.]|nr:hypothetical protein [Flavisolibacter sp.]
MTTLITLFLSSNLILNTQLFSVKNQPSTQSFEKITFASKSFISEWETASSWQQSSFNGKHQYTLKRMLPLLNKSILEEGVVLVFTKGYTFLSKKVDKPLSLPFYFFMENANMPLHWSVKPTLGTLEVELQVPSDNEQAFLKEKNELQLRYILLEKEFLKNKKLTPQTVRNMSYQQVVALLSIAP